MAGFWNVGKIPELRGRLLYTAALLAVYRVGIFISTPGVDRVALHKAFANFSGTLFGFLNMFSGGGFEQASIFALGIAPYISSSIIIQLLTVVIPALERLQKEGEAGRRKINQYMRYGTILLAIIQGSTIANVLVQGPGGVRVVHQAGPLFYVTTVATLTAGTTFIMWLGEQITERGIGNGISLIIFAGIVAQFPGVVLNTLKYLQSDMVQPLTLLFLAGLLLAVIYGIIYCEQATRQIPVQYAKRQVGQQTVAGQTSYLPLKINTAGVIPPYLRLIHPDVPRHPGQLLPQQLHCRLAAQLDRRFLAVQRGLCRPHRLFLLLLHRDDLQPGRRRRQHEEVRRLHPRHPPRQEDRRLHRPRPHSNHLRRRRLHLGDLRLADPAGQQV